MDGSVGEVSLAYDADADPRGSVQLRPSFRYVRKERIFIVRQGMPCEFGLWQVDLNEGGLSRACTRGGLVSTCHFRSHPRRIQVNVANLGVVALSKRLQGLDHLGFPNRVAEADSVGFGTSSAGCIRRRSAARRKPNCGRLRQRRSACDAGWFELHDAPVNNRGPNVGDPCGIDPV